jgi:assimilatory nitrate reductase catalytic subunit
MNANAPIAAPVRTTCPYCGVGCGLRIQPEKSGAVSVTGDPVHPANRGRICSKGAALGETIGLDQRLLHPFRRAADGTLARVTWDKALDEVASGFARIAQQHGPDSVAFYLSGQLLTEDYYVANKLMKGFIGSANVDTNSRLCMASSVAGHRRAFGADTVPGTYDDLDTADLIVLVGSNAAWCHPVLYQRMVRNRQERGAKIVVIDPRRTATCEDADLFLPIAPGTDSALFCGLLAYLADHLALDFNYIDAHTTGFEDTLASARTLAPNVAETARACGLVEADVAQFFELFRKTVKTVTCYSQGVNQSAQGTDKVNAIVNCHLATARIGRAGMGPFSLTGQPNAMGGREVGGLANQLAAHMNFTPSEIDRVRRFWNAPRMAEREGLKAVQMFEAIARGEIKALWVMATNPAVSLPEAGAVREALKKLELFVVSENVVSNDTVNSGAHILLPASGWGEKDGTVTNSERRISRQRAFMPSSGDAKPDWWIVTQVARRMGFADAFSYQGPADVFREHAALSAFENEGTRDFDLGALADLSDADYAALKPVQWPARKGMTPQHDIRFFADGGFFTPDRKSKFVAPQPPALREETSEAFPFRLNTGRIRDQWHTMTRTGKSPRLATHLAEPFVEVHPEDAATAGLTDGGFARVTSAHGSCVLKVSISEGQRRGSLFAPIHWSGVTASSARVGDLVAPRTDPHSGQPEAKATPAALAPVELPLRGFTRTRRPIAFPEGTWWTRVATARGEETRIATDKDSMFWHDLAHNTLGQDAQLVEYVETDKPQALYRAAAFVDGEFDGCISIGPDDAALRWDTLDQVIAAGPPKDGAPPVVMLCQPDTNAAAGPTVCACFDVGLNTVRDALRAGEVSTVEDIARQFKAGTNCGSCLPELKRITARERAAAKV